MRLIDADELEIDEIDDVRCYSILQVDEAPTVQTVSIDVLDKIRFEIEHDKNIATKDYVLGLSLALQTIDKYRESGDKK